MANHPFTTYAAPRPVSADTKRRCEKLRHRGRSIGEIATELGLSESTTHKYVKHIELTSTQRKRLYRKWLDAVVKANSRRRGQTLKAVLYRKPEWSADLVRLIAHLNFDGRIDRYGLCYYGRSRAQILRVKQLVRTLLGVSPAIRKRASGIWVLSYYHVELAAWLLERETEIINIVHAHQEWRCEWLKALFDDEGHVYVNGTTRRIRASQNRLTILRTAQSFLNTLDIITRLDKRAAAIEITGRENLIQFQRKIDFSPGLRVNGARGNSIWKRSVEKRALLRHALKTYLD